MDLETECYLASWWPSCWLRKIEVSLQALLPISSWIAPLHIEENTIPEI